jgi:hypothetical protein
MARVRTTLLLLPLALAASAHSGPASESVRAAPAPAQLAADTSFAGLVARLSEPGGYFDSDNLISNEASYLHVIGALRERGTRGGAYVGVGPDQNFSYIAEIRPEVAFIIDIRRDNLLHHLLFRAIFANATNRLDYLCLLFGRDAPGQLVGWNDAPLTDMVEYIDAMPFSNDAFEAAHERVHSALGGFGVPLDPADLATIRRFHAAFATAGLDLRFTSRGRISRPYYPDYRQLLLETDRTGSRANYLADRERFDFLRTMQHEGRIIPVVGNLAGDHALAAIGREITRRELRLSLLYTSNVEYYLMLDRTFDTFARTVAASFPFDARSVIVRSYFSRGLPHPQSVAGYYATQVAEPVEAFVAETGRSGYASYYDLVSRNVLPAR